MRLGLSNHILAALFHIQDKRAVFRIVHQVTDAVLKNFFPDHLDFRHISHHTVLEQHRTAIAKVLLTDNDQQVVVVIDGRYLYVQKSAHNELQRPIYSMHNHRHLIKPMAITTTVKVLSFFL